MSLAWETCGTGRGLLVGERCCWAKSSKAGLTERYLHRCRLDSHRRAGFGGSGSRLVSCHVAKKRHGNGSDFTTATNQPVEGEMLSVERERDSINPVKTSGLRRTTMSAGVKNATQRYLLPPPAVAVRNLVEQAQFAHLCTVMSCMHHRRAGYPFGTLVDFASDGKGYPIFCLSPLAIHTRNIMEDPRSSLVVQMPGWSGLANARVTIFGDVYQLPVEMQDGAREVFLQKHTTEKEQRWVSGNSVFFRMHRISDIYFVGGFGTVQWVDVAEYAAVKPDEIVMTDPHTTLRVLNDNFAATISKLLGDEGVPADEASFVSIDRLGTDVRVRSGTDYSVKRIGFDSHVETLEDAIAAMQRTLDGDLRPKMRSRTAM